MDSLTLYGLNTCDTCRKARSLLTEADVTFKYHDIRADGLTIQMLERWADATAWEQLLNKRSLTWRKIPTLDRQNLNRAKALALILEHPTVLKRPVLDVADEVVIGFDAERYRQLV